MTWTIGSILNWTKQYFMDKGVESPRLDAEVLLSHILGKERIYLYINFDKPLQNAELSAFREVVRKRAMRLPVAYIIGCKEFMGLDFAVNSAVLIPRPDTEVLVEEVLGLLKEVREPEILDLGTGSGAIIISLLHKFPQAVGTAVDISNEAIAVARKNAKRHGVESRLGFFCGDLWQPVAGRKYDAVLSNPPYIIDSEIDSLQAEVKHEPLAALAGGADGLDFYRRILSAGHTYLKANGFIAIEVGTGHAAEVVEFAAQAEFKIEKIIADYAGIERVIVLKHKDGLNAY